jgi:hypothetical protein
MGYVTCEQEIRNNLGGCGLRQFWRMISSIYSINEGREKKFRVGGFKVMILSSSSSFSSSPPPPQDLQSVVYLVFL